MASVMTPTIAAVVSLSVDCCVRINAETIRKTGTMKAYTTANNPRLLFPHTKTSSFSRNVSFAGVAISIIFSFFSDAVHMALAWHSAQAECCVIFTYIIPSFMRSTIPLCLIVVSINLQTRHYKTRQM